MLDVASTLVQVHFFVKNLSSYYCQNLNWTNIFLEPKKKNTILEQYSNNHDENSQNPWQDYSPPNT